MKLAIQNGYGWWWTGKNWGTSDDREVYENLSNLPSEIAGLQLIVHSTTPNQDGFLDVYYYGKGKDYPDPDATVEQVDY